MNTSNHNSDMFNSVIQSGQNAIKTSFLLNGGAVIALLTFIGHLIALSNTPKISLISFSILFYSLGVLSTTVASGATYLSQRFYAYGSVKIYCNKIGLILNIFVVILITASYVLFFLGTMKAYNFFLQFS